MWISLQYCSYRVLVGARDGGNPPLESSDTVTIDIDVNSKNNTAPRFLTSYSKQINSTVPVNTFVLRVEATDPDTSAVLSYRIVGKCGC